LNLSLFQILFGDFCDILCGCPAVVMVPILGLVVEQPQSLTSFPVTGSSPKKGRVLLVIQLGSSQQFPISVRFLDRRRNPAKVDGVPEWLTDNSEVLSLEPSGDGLSCVVRAMGPLGTANVTLSADADLGDGSTPVIGTIEVEVTAGAATVVELTPGTPEEQPEA
jgi:hypothetical protein